MAKVIIDNTAIIDIDGNIENRALVIDKVEQLYEEVEYECGKKSRQMQRELQAISGLYNKTQANFLAEIKAIDAKKVALGKLLYKIIDGAPLDIKEI